MKYLILLLLSSITLQAEPARWGFIFKDKQCSEYWQGDECVNYTVPAGWTEIYFDNKGRMRHRGKTCKSFNDKKKCCEQMGFSYVKLNLEKILINSNLDFCSDRN